MSNNRLTSAQSAKLNNLLEKHYDRFAKWPYDKIARVASNKLGFSVNANHVRYRFKEPTTPTNSVPQQTLFERVADLEQRLLYLETELGVR